MWVTTASPAMESTAQSASLDRLRELQSTLHAWSTPAWGTAVWDISTRLSTGGTQSETHQCETQQYRKHHHGTDQHGTHRREVDQHGTHQHGSHQHGTCQHGSHQCG